MCGIAGLVYLDRSRQVKPIELERMTEVMIHRGPDDQGFYINNNVGLGFRRLSIIDLSTGNQPLANEDGSVWVVFNGEIYNFQELRANLIVRGHKFKTKTDTEVIVHLYEEFGSACVNHLRGMFAFVIWDDKHKKVFCARDRFGIKPFYYFLDNKQFVFGSELKVLLTNQSIPKQVDIEALDHYFAFGYITKNISIYQSINKLKPAHTLELSLLNGSVKILKYWNIDYQPNYQYSQDRWCEEIREVLLESVKMRMISDVPLGAFLSGGIDSSSVVALMSQLSNQQVKTFSIGFKEQEYNELRFAREIVEKYQTDHYEYMLEPESVDLLPKLVRAYDEPFADASAIPTYYLSKFTRNHVTVALSGDGGDELFAGYNNYPKMKAINRYNLLPHQFNRRFWGSVYDRIPLKVKGKGITYFLSRKRQKVGAYFTTITLPERAKLYKPHFWHQVKDDYAEIYKEKIIDECDADFLSKMQYMDISTWLVDDVLTKVDRASMHNSLEVRVPLLDHKFAELTFKIPSNLKLKGWDKKHIFKLAMQRDLTYSVINHKKQGFSVPLKMWFKSSLKDLINDKLRSQNSYISEYLNMEYVNKIIDDHNTGMRDLNTKIWAMLFLETWLENHHASKINS